MSAKYRSIAQRLGVPFANLSKGAINRQVISLLPGSVALERRVVPLTLRDNTLVVAMSAIDERTVERTVEQLEELVGRRVEVAIADPEELTRALDEYYG